MPMYPGTAQSCLLTEPSYLRPDRRRRQNHSSPPSVAAWASGQGCLVTELIKKPNKSNLPKKGSILAHSSGQTTMAEKSRRQELEATSHVASTIMDREWWMHVIVQNPSLYNPGSQSRNDATRSGQEIKNLYIGLLPTYISGHQVLDWYI